MKTLRVAISHAVNAIHKLADLCTSEAESDRLRRVRNDYFVLWQRVILADLNQESSAFAAAIDAMELVRSLAVEARAGDAPVSEALSAAEEAMPTIERSL